MQKRNTKSGSAGKKVSTRFPDTEMIIEGIRSGDRVMLSKAITLAESAREDHQELARKVLDHCLPLAGNSLRLGITGSPGVGKSTFIETFGSWLIESGRKPAVLAIDPSSQLTKGSILGDKTRMHQLAADERAFIRPSPAGNSSGGVANRTRETILLCEAAGFDTIIIETVGVGQSELSVHSMVDFFLLLIQPGAGDELQGIKRGIVEMADLLVVTKSDGPQIAAARNTTRDYGNVLHLFPAKPSSWTPQSLACSGLKGDGMEQIWDSILSFQKLTQENGWFEKNRKYQLKNWLHELIERALKSKFQHHKGVLAQIASIEQKVVEGKLPASAGAEELLRIFFNDK